MMEIHGTNDIIVPYGLSSRFGESVGALANLEKWHDLNTCQGDVVTDDGAQYEVRAYRDCADSMEVALVTLAGVGHSPYRGQGTSVDTTQLAWDFVKRFHKRRGGDTGDGLVSSAQCLTYLHMSVILALLPLHFA